MQKHIFLEKIAEIRPFLIIADIAKQLPDLNAETVSRYVRGTGGNNEVIMRDIYRIAKKLYLAHKKQVNSVRV